MIDDAGCDGGRGGGGGKGGNVSSLNENRFVRMRRWFD